MLAFSEEASAMDPWFKMKTNKEEVFDRPIEVAVRQVSDRHIISLRMCNIQSPFMKAIRSPSLSFLRMRMWQ